MNLKLESEGYQIMSGELSPPVNHVFVDFENVQAVDATIFSTKTVHLTLLLGPKNTKLATTLVENLLQHAATVELVRLSSSGRNALDFALAYYLGQAVLADPCGYFHLVSEDSGYDPLIDHLRSKHINVRRHKDFTTLTFSTRPGSPKRSPSPAGLPSSVSQKPAGKPSPSPDPLASQESKALQFLCKPSTKLPEKVKSLARCLKTHLGNKINDADALRLVEHLGQAGHLFVHETGKVTYSLPVGATGIAGSAIL